jgi:hypothetical protein
VVGDKSVSAVGALKAPSCASTGWPHSASIIAANKNSEGLLNVMPECRFIMVVCLRLSMLPIV